MGARMNGREDGAVLVIVLWTIAAISLAVAGALSTAVASASLARAEQRGLDAQADLRGAVEAAAWSQLRADPAARWLADGHNISLTINGQIVQLQIHDAAGLLDVNRADIDLLRNLFEATAVSRQAADAAADAIAAARGDVSASGDDANAATASVEGATTAQVDPQHAFASVAEIVPLLGGDSGLLSRALPLLTIYGRTGRMDPALAPATLLAAVPDIAPEEVQSLLSGRAGGHLVSDDAQAIAAKYAQYLDAGSAGIYRIDASAGFRRSSAVILLMRDGAAPYHVLAWSDGA